MILTEGSVGAGARRIEAVTSGEAYAVLHARSKEAEALRGQIEDLRKEVKRKPKEAERAQDVEVAPEAVDGVNVIVTPVTGVEVDGLLDLTGPAEGAHMRRRSSSSAPSRPTARWRSSRTPTRPWPSGSPPST